MVAARTLRREPPLTDEQLALAWRHLRRPGWPDTIDAALVHPLRGPCIRGLARNLSRSGHVSVGSYRPPSHAHAPPGPATPTQPPPKRSDLGQAARKAVDRKRAAANDFD